MPVVQDSNGGNRQDLGVSPARCVARRSYFQRMQVANRSVTSNGSALPVASCWISAESSQKILSGLKFA